MVSCCCGRQGFGARQRGTACTVWRKLLDWFLQVVCGWGQWQAGHCYCCISLVSLLPYLHWWCTVKHKSRKICSLPSSTLRDILAGLPRFFLVGTTTVVGSLSALEPLSSARWKGGFCCINGLRSNCERCMTACCIPGGSTRRRSRGTSSVERLVLTTEVTLVSNSQHIIQGHDRKGSKTKLDVYMQRKNTSAAYQLKPCNHN